MWRWRWSDVGLSRLQTCCLKSLALSLGVAGGGCCHTSGPSQLCIFAVKACHTRIGHVKGYGVGISAHKYLFKKKKTYEVTGPHHITSSQAVAHHSSFHRLLSRRLLFCCCCFVNLLATHLLSSCRLVVVSTHLSIVVRLSSFIVMS